nr:MAG TPA: protein of unknown function (DUF951) [Caudoviricetes sp.]
MLHLPCHTMTCWVIKGICKFRVPHPCGALCKT